MRHLVSLLLCAAALIAGEQTGRRAPGFALPDVNMKLYDLADSGGKVVILEFTQTDCAHCATFAPVLNQVQQKYGAKVAILAVANTPHENANTVGQYVKSHGITFRSALRDLRAGAEPGPAKIWRKSRDPGGCQHSPRKCEYGGPVRQEPRNHVPRALRLRPDGILLRPQDV